MRAKSINKLNESDTPAGVALQQLQSIQDKSAELLGLIDDSTEVNPWIAGKLTKAQDYLSNIIEHFKYGDDQESGPEMIDDEPTDLEVPLDGERVDIDGDEFTMEPLQGNRIDITDGPGPVAIDPEDELEMNDIPDSMSPEDEDKDDFQHVSRAMD